MNIVINLVDVKHQTKHPDDVLRKIRSDQAKIAGRITTKIGEYAVNKEYISRQWHMKIQNTYYHVVG